MGKIFLEHLGGKKIFACCKCKTPLTNRLELRSKNYVTSSGVAYLFNKVVNVVFGQVRKKKLKTGVYLTSNVYCKCCNSKVGGRYEYSFNQQYKYKEGKITLRMAVVKKLKGLRNEI